MKELENIGKYILNSTPQELSRNLLLCEECENESGELFDILVIKITESNDRKIKRIVDYEISPLINQEIPGFVKIIETGVDDNQHFCYIVYEHFGNDTYEKKQSNIDVSSIIKIAEGLNWFKTKDNSQKFIISPRYIRVDDDGNARLLFAKLFDVFADENILEENYLSPETKKYLLDKNQPSPKLQSDVFSLVKSFECFLIDNYSNDYQHFIDEITEKGLAEKRLERFSKYSELIDMLKQLPSVKKADYPTIRIITQKDKMSDFEKVVESMNKNIWILLDSTYSNLGEITGQFTTDDYNGRFFVNDEGCIFIPYNGCRNEKNNRIIQHEDSFLAEYNFTLYPSKRTYHCYEDFKEKFQERNSLSMLHTTQKSELETWQKLPETEKEFIEYNAFKVEYVKRELSKDGNRIIFTLNDNTKQNWGKIREIKNEHKILFVEEILVGEILDWRSENKTITIKDAKCNIEELPETGELAEDIRQETSQFKKQVEACQKFLKNDVVNKDLCDIIATPEYEIPCRVHDLDYESFKDELFNPNLKNDPSQLEAVLEAITYKPMYLIQGPPGAGKTTVIVEIIRQLVKRQKDIKILLTSQSNLAVDNVLEKLVDLKNIPFMRLASENALENDSVSDTMKQHCYEEKLRKWVTDTEQKSREYFQSKFSQQESIKDLDNLFDAFNEAKNNNDFKSFKKSLNSSPNYIKKIFEDVPNFKQTEYVFENQFGKEYFHLKQIQKDWFAFISNTLVNADSEGKRKKSMLNNGSQKIDFLTAMLMQTNVVGATCIHIASSRYSKVNFRFDYVIMDESSKATPAESLVPISMGQNIIMIGDDKQLPPVITREDAVKQGIKDKLEDEGLDIEKTYGVSLFEKIKKAFMTTSNKKYVKMLDIQYRMPKQLGSLISEYFYDSKLNNPEIPEYDEHKTHNLVLTKPTSIVFLSTSKRKKHNDNNDKFKRQNQCNVDVIKKLLDKLDSLCVNNPQKDKPFNIGIIAGYRGQVELLKLQIDIKKYHNFVSIDNTPLIEINTVDKFQGAERDIIIYDVVRSSQGHDNIGFLADYRRINVAFSRAKRLLFVVGDSEYLLKRANFTPSDDFPEFKLRLITERFKKDGLIFNDLNEVFDER